jgi:phospholipid N-methyltransferase
MPLTWKQATVERGLFLEKFAKEVWHGKFEVGAIGPTCKAVRRKMFKHFLPHTRRVVNVGAGTGPMERDLADNERHTRHLKQLKDWIALEPYSPFADFFEETVKDDRVEFHRQYSSVLPIIIHPNSADMVVTTVPRFKNDNDQIEFSRGLFEHVRDGGRYMHAIFNTMPELLAEATKTQLEKILIVPASGQLLPPWLYQLQIIDKPAKNTAYSYGTSPHRNGQVLKKIHLHEDLSSEWE